MYLGGGPYHGQMGYCCNGEWFFEHAIGARYGLNTETANANPLFTINKQEGAIYFSSDMSGKSVVLEYVSDGMNNGNDSEINVNKLFEEKIKPNPRFNLKMLHFFINTGIKDSAYYWSELSRFVYKYCEMKKICPELDSIDLGGGLPIQTSLQFNYDYQAMVDEIVESISWICNNSASFCKYNFLAIINSFGRK